MKSLVFFHESEKLWPPSLRHAYENHKTVGYEHKRLFEKNGYPTVVCDVGKRCDIEKVLKLLKSDSIYFTMGTNAAGLDFYASDGMGLLEKYSVPHVAFFADHPYMGKELFMNRLKNAHLYKLFCCLVNGEVDKECIKLEGLEKKVEGYVYAAPYFDFEDVKCSTERDIDVLFTGRLYTNKKPDRSWNHTSLSSLKKKQLNDIADYLECNAVTVYDGFHDILYECGMENEMPQYYSYFNIMLSYIMKWRRLKLVDTLVQNHVPLFMCDASWYGYKGADNIKILDTKYQETLNLYKRAKIVVADLAGFNRYTHDRVLHAAKYGAAVICENSTWMEKYFYSQGAAIKFEWNRVDDIPNIIEHLLTDETNRSRMTEKAHAILKTQFSGEAYVNNILSIIAEKCPDRRW